jgi:hypothetical protein
LFDPAWANVIDPTLGKWAEIVLTKLEGDSWTLSAAFNGKEMKEIGTVRGVTLQDALYSLKGSWLNSDHTSTIVYVTEVRGTLDASYQPATAWGTNLEASAFTGTQTETPAPNGYETVYEATGWNLSTIDLSSYSEVRFAMRTNGFVLWKADWSDVSHKKGVWAEVRLVKVGENTWDITFSYNDNGEKTFSGVVGATLAELLPYNVFKPDTEKALVLDVTEIRAM